MNEHEKQVAWAEEFAALAEREILYYSFTNDLMSSYPWCAPWMMKSDFDLDRITPAAHFAAVKDKMKEMAVAYDPCFVRARKLTRRKINQVKAHDMLKIVYKHLCA